MELEPCIRAYKPIQIDDKMINPASIPQTGPGRPIIRSLIAKERFLAGLTNTQVKFTITRRA